MKRTLNILLALVVAGSAVLPAMAQAETDEAFPDDYQSGDFGRIRFQENGVTLVRAAFEDAPDARAEGSVNAPVFPGDTIQTATNQRVEVQLAGGTLVRVDRGTDLTFQALPDPYADFIDNAILKLSYGAIQISAQLSDKEEFRVDTPQASIYLLGDGDFRIEVDDRGKTRALSRRGVAEVVGDGGSVLLRGGMRTTVFTGSAPEDPRSFNTFVTDAFDRWVEDREDSYRLRDHYVYQQEVDPYEELPYEVRPYYGELSRHGRWVWVADYGYCWYPFDVGAGWRPYYDGYWSYGPRGYFWVSYEPWGWAPYHYGRWNWVSGYGWCWIPGRVFGGAWVSWSWGSVYVGWSPLDYWNRPAYVGRVYYGYYDPHCWTFIDYRHFKHRHYRRYAVTVHDVGDHLRRTAVVSRAPRVSPRRLAEDGQWRERVARRARDDDRARLPVVSKDNRPARRFIDIENRLANRRLPGARRAAGNRDDATAPPSGRRVDRPRDVRPVDRKRTVASGDQATRPRGDLRRGSAGPAATPRASTAPGGRVRSQPPDRRRVERKVLPRSQDRATAPGRKAAPDRAERPSRVSPRKNDSTDTDSRLKNLYRRIPEPRKTQERQNPRASRPDSGQSQSQDKGTSAQKPRAPRREVRPAPRSSRPQTRPAPRKAPPRREVKSPSRQPNPRAQSRSGSSRSAPPRREVKSPSRRSTPRAQPKSGSSKSSSSKSRSSGKSSKGGGKAKRK